MPRRKPFSNKQRKVQLQEKRASKRGESPPPESKELAKLRHEKVMTQVGADNDTNSVKLEVLG
jgi:hypothetical protein